MPLKLNTQKMQLIKPRAQVIGQRKPDRGQQAVSFRKTRRIILCGLILAGCPAALTNAQDRTFVSNSRLVFGTETELSASVRSADLDGDGDADMIVANGRHWPQQNYILLNDGKSRFTVVRPLGTDLSTSYAAEPIDVDGDGDVDIVTGNAMAPCQVFLNDGRATFSLSRPLQGISSVRSLTVADVDGDADLDVISTSRGMPNVFHLNDGRGFFTQGGTFGAQTDSTIDVAVADLNQDQKLDLVLANRDMQMNAVLLQNDPLRFSSTSPGRDAYQTRAVAVADLNADGHPDCIFGNIGAANEVYFGDAQGVFSERAVFGTADRQTYGMAVGDLDRDGDLDVVTSVVDGPCVAFFNHGDGRSFRELNFGDPHAASYGLCLADFDGDGFPDVAVANSGAPNQIFLNRPSRLTAVDAGRSGPTRKSRTNSSAAKSPVSEDEQSAAPDNVGSTVGNSQTQTADWPRFRGAGGVGVADGFDLPVRWNADPDLKSEDSGLLWRTKVPGLSHSSPVIVGDLLLVATAVSAAGDAPLKIGRSGAADAADDHGEQQWMVLCFQKSTGSLLWKRTCRSGEPRATRHEKATHANTTLTVDRGRVFAFFGSEGLYCLDLEGQLLWEQDFGVINISKYGIGWGYASSPAVFEDRVVLVCDDPARPFLLTLDAHTGEEVWRVSREGETERNWSTPFVYHDGVAEQNRIVINGWPSVIAYELSSGEEVWRIRGGGDNPVPTPFAVGKSLFITSAHGAEAPVHAVRFGVQGDLTDLRRTAPNESFLWSMDRGGAYMSTPVVYDGCLYVGNSNGVLRCFDATSGDSIYEQRLGTGASMIASLVAGDGKIYCACENGFVYVVNAGRAFELLSKNTTAEPCYATPAISEGVLYLRTTTELMAIGQPNN